MSINITKGYLASYKMQGFKRILFITVFILVYSQEHRSQTDSSVTRKDLLNLFYDCEFCNQAFYRQEINFVNFVRDRRLADVYALLTVNRIGTGGNEYKLFLSGQNKFKGQADTLVFQSEPNATDADLRSGILEILKKGLLKYLVQTDLLKKINYTIELNGDHLMADKVKDKWNFWTFNINGNLNGNANSYQSFLNVSGNISANRTTEKFRTETGGWYNLNTQKFIINDTTTVKGLQSNLGGYHLMAFSVGKHFALGHYATYFQSTVMNLKNSTSYYPGIEYNVFDYAQASRRQLRFIYRIGVRYQDYFERTVYNRIYEWYGIHAFVVQWSQIEKWGSLNLNAGAWHYFNHVKNYNASIYPSIDFNPLKGLRVGLWCGFSMVNDQFFIRATDASASEILLNQVQLKTDYNYNYGINLNYTFGSKFNNVINVRFNLDDNYW